MVNCMHSQGCGLSSWRRRLPPPRCSHIWGGTKCSTRLWHGTEDSALAARGRRTTSAGLPGLRTLHLIAEQLLGLYQKGVVVEKYSQVGLEHIDVSLM